MKLTCLTLLLFFLMNSSVFSQKPKNEIIPLWPQEIPGETEAKHEAVVTDDTSRNVIRLTDVTNPVLTVFEPEPSKNLGAGIVVCPGGGYNILAINLEGYEIAQWLNSLGYTAFVLQYRVPQKQEGALQDVQRALRLVRSRASQWKVNPEQVGVLGFSAGGSLSARASTLYNTQTYTAVDSADGLSCRPDFSLLIYPAYLDQGNNRSLTPELKVDEKTPPMFIFCTADDPYAHSGLVMAGALRDAKVPVELHLLPTGGHGYGLRPGNVAAETWPALATQWMKQFIPLPQGR